MSWHFRNEWKSTCLCKGENVRFKGQNKCKKEKKRKNKDIFSKNLS